MCKVLRYGNKKIVVFRFCGRSYLLFCYLYNDNGLILIILFVVIVVRNLNCYFYVINVFEISEIIFLIINMYLWVFISGGKNYFYCFLYFKIYRIIYSLI